MTCPICGESCFKCPHSIDEIKDAERIRESLEDEQEVTGYAVLEKTGGWGGTSQSENIYFVFTSESAAKEYAEKRRKNRLDDLFEYEIFEVELK